MFIGFRNIDFFSFPPIMFSFMIDLGLKHLEGGGVKMAEE